MSTLHTVPETQSGQRLDRYLKHLFPTVPFVVIQKLLRTGQVRVDGKRAKPDTRLDGGATLRLPPTLEAPQTSILRDSRAARTNPYQATNADFQMLKDATLHEDKHLLVLNKPAGLAAQAGSGITRSLDRLLAAAYGADKTPRLAHRLDRDTTGLILAGKNRTTAAALALQFQNKTIQKSYLALVTGTPEGQGGEVKTAIKKVGPIAVIARDGDSAHTSWKILSSPTATLHLIEATPHTGRMNQIRVHMASIGLPLVGDDKYGTPESKEATRQLHPTGKAPLYLHARQLTLTHPTTSEAVTFTAPPPPHFAKLLNER